MGLWRGEIKHRSLKKNGQWVLVNLDWSAVISVYLEGDKPRGDGIVQRDGGFETYPRKNNGYHPANPTTARQLDSLRSLHVPHLTVTRLSTTWSGD